MEKGISKHWTPEKEAAGQRMIDSCHTFAARHLMATMRDILKYDQRTRAGRRATAQAKLRLATATDKDLKQMAILYIDVVGVDKGETPAEVFARLVVDRNNVREKGFQRSEIECP